MSRPDTTPELARPPRPTLVDAAARIHSAAIHLLRRARVEDEASGLSASRLSALSVLVFGGPRPLGELAAAEQVTSATMSRLVDALEAAGLARRVADPEDRRSVIVEPTAAGKRRLRRAQNRRIRLLVGVLESRDPEDLETLSEAARIIEEALRSTAG